MAGVEAKKQSFAVEEDPKIVAGSLEGLAEHRAGKGKSFDSVDDLKAYLENSEGHGVHLMPHPQI
jgi:hypothetical protein